MSELNSARSIVRSYGNQSTYLRPGPITSSRATAKDLTVNRGTTVVPVVVAVGGLTKNVRNSSSMNPSNAVKPLKNRLHRPAQRLDSIDVLIARVYPLGTSSGQGCESG